MLKPPSFLCPHADIFSVAGAEMRRLWVGPGPSSSLLLLLLTSLGLGSTARPPGIPSLLLPLLGLTSSGRPPGAGTEEHTIRYNGDVNIGQCFFIAFH